MRQGPNLVEEPLGKEHHSTRSARSREPSRVPPAPPPAPEAEHNLDGRYRGRRSQIRHPTSPGRMIKAPKKGGQQPPRSSNPSYDEVPYQVSRPPRGPGTHDSRLLLSVRSTLGSTLTNIVYTQGYHSHLPRAEPEQKLQGPVESAARAPTGSVVDLPFMAIYSNGRLSLLSCCEAGPRHLRAISQKH